MQGSWLTIVGYTKARTRLRFAGAEAELSCARRMGRRGPELSRNLETHAVI